MKQWFLKLGTLTSQAANALLFGGNPDESMSARAWRENRPIYKVINKIFFWEDNHCRNAHLTDVQHAEELTQHKNIRS